MIDRSAGQARWWALGALVISTLAVGLDTTVLSVALPTLAQDLHASTGQLQWFLDSYNLVLAAVVLPAGLLADRFGRRRLLIGALALFGASSIWCAYAGSATGLIMARVVLGIGAAFLLVLPSSVLATLFPPAERGRAVAIWTMASFASLPLGPIIGGFLLNTFWWGSVFLINVPVVIIAVIAVTLLMPESGELHRVRFDPVGLLLGVGGFVVLTFGVIEAGERGWSDPLVWAAMCAAVALIAGFIGWQLRLQARKAKDEQLLIDLSIFTERGFSWGIVLAVLASFSMFGLLFAAPQYFQAVLGNGALGTGLRLLPMVGGLIVGGRIGSAVSTRLGAKALVGTGFVVMAVGLFLGATTSMGTSFAFTGTWLAIYGVGLGLCLPTTMTAAISAMPADRSGMGSGLLMSSRMVGGSIGVAVLGSIVNSGYRSDLDLSGLSGRAADSIGDGVSTGVRVAAALRSPSLLDSVQSAFLHGMDVMLVSCGILTVVAAILGVLFLPNGLSERVASVGPQIVDSGESEHDVVVPDPADRQR